MNDKITIIEGPPPTFELIGDAWALGLNECPTLSGVAITRLRTYNGNALVERCHRTWRDHSTMHLEFRSMEGLQSQAPILAARTLDVDDGQLLILWVRVDLPEGSADAEGPDDIEDDIDLPGSS